MSKKTVQKQKVMEEILVNDVRRLNFRAMKYFVYHGRLGDAAICRDRVGAWNRKGPVPSVPPSHNFTPINAPFRNG